MINCPCAVLNDILHLIGFVLRAIMSLCLSFNNNPLLFPSCCGWFLFRH